MTNANPSLAKDEQHIKILAICHFAKAGFSLFGIGFVFLHYTLMKTVFSNPQAFNNAPFRPDQFFGVFKWFYLFFGAMMLLNLVVNILSGLFQLNRKYWMFSVIVAAYNCISFPVGTALGIFTLIVLMRDSVKVNCYNTAPR